MAEILVITHQLTRTGAPIVLFDMVKVLLGAGHHIDMISMLDGDLRSEAEELGIEVSIEAHFFDKKDFYSRKFSEYDCLIVNTLICYEAIHVLRDTDAPVLWWIHEGEHFFEYFRSVIPDIKNLPSHIHVFSVSGYVQRVIEKRYGVHTPILHFGVEDLYEKNAVNSSDWESFDPGHKKIRFFTCALYGRVKGQDFAARTIEQLPEELRDKCIFVFCGDESEQRSDPAILGKVIEASEKYPSLVKHIGKIPHEKVIQFMAGMDFLLVPSRIEPMPTVACEAMMVKKPVLVSDVCGVADDITDGWNGLVFKSEDEESLTQGIIRCQNILVDPSVYESMAERARNLYEEKYSMSVFGPATESLVSHILRRRKLILMLSGRDILDIFSLAMKPEFERLGYEVYSFDNQRIMQSLAGLDQFLNTPVTAALAFNNTGMSMEIIAGKNVWEQLQIPFIDFLMDHPFAHKAALDTAPSTAIVLCPDRNHMKYVQRFYPEIGITGFMGHGGKASVLPVKPIAERHTDVIYAGNLSRVFVQQIMPDFDNDFSDIDADMRSIASDSLNYLIAHPSNTTEAVIEKELLAAGVELTDKRLCEVIEKLHYIDLLAVSYYREKAVRVLAEAGIDIELYGTGWEDCDFIKLPNVHFGYRISADEVVERMHDAKMVLSTMTWFKDGTHDRVFNGMLSGAVVLTDTSVYMKENFAGLGYSDDPELVMFELEKMDDRYGYPTIDELPAVVKNLLGNQDLMQQIADTGRARALKSETWEKRADEMDRDLLEQL